MNFKILKKKRHEYPMKKIFSNRFHMDFTKKTAVLFCVSGNSSEHFLARVVGSARK